MSIKERTKRSLLNSLLNKEREQRVSFFARGDLKKVLFLKNRKLKESNHAFGN
jgi:hypothetical protein